MKVKSSSQKITFPKGLTHFWLHMRKLNGSIVITGSDFIHASRCSGYVFVLPDGGQNVKRQTDISIGIRVDDLPKSVFMRAFGVIVQK